ncbi:MAG: hypothetical protein KGJ62_05990 [Armatimonadetes bacterium]|nr:hypothetical protein [Armatimonadota bacterium]MDE2207034.1 hypothetical protein [Armatimonadota bacterium]
MEDLYVRAKLTNSAGRHWGVLMASVLLAVTYAQARGQAGGTPPAAGQTGVAVQPPPPGGGIDFRTRPRYPTDPQRLRRTVQIDGVLEDGEWDPFYTIDDGPIQGTFYCNWDDNYLYLAAKTNQPSTVLIDVDTGGDGWLHGANNLELLVSDVSNSAPPTVTTRLLDAATNKDVPAWNLTAVDPKTIQVAGKVDNGTQVIELAIPKNTASLVLRPGATISLRAEFLPPAPASAYPPTQPYDPHLLLDANLVDTRTSEVAGVLSRLSLSDYKCIAGERLFATLELDNQTDIPMDINTVEFTGRGLSVNAVNTLREVTVPSLPGLKKLKLPYNTVLPPNLAVGSYTLDVTVDMGKGRQLHTDAAFSVVQPLQVQMSANPATVVVNGPSRANVDVSVFSAVPNGMTGNVQLTGFPSGWILQGGAKRSVHVDRADAQRVVRYQFNVRSDTPPGDYPVSAVVTWHGIQISSSTVVHVIVASSAHPTAPPPANPPH